MSVGSDTMILGLHDHLRELRTRLFRVTLAVLALGGLSLAFAREVFHFLVLPILNALPEGDRMLVQTSAIEELNTFFKVGIYAGITLSTPIALQQIWGFVSPGLYESERRMALPFVVAGSAFFMAGTGFCYAVVLPPAFEFLLNPRESGGSQARLQLASDAVNDAARLARLGDLVGAETLLSSADVQLGALPDGDPNGTLALRERIRLLDASFEAAERTAAGHVSARDALVAAIRARHAAGAAALGGDRSSAAREVAEAERQIARVWPLGGTGEFAERALFERQAAASARIAAATEQVSLGDWTKPMLSMREQLNLVLILLLAFGLIFEIPVVFSLLAALGVVTGEGLARARKYAVVANVIVAALITPTGDPFNLALMAVPMMLCYEIGVLSARIITARRLKDQGAAALELG